MSIQIVDDDGQPARYLESTDGQTITLTILDEAGDPIDASSVTQVICSLRSDDTEAAIFTSADCTPGTGRGSIIAGKVAITLTVADTVAVGSRGLQQRRMAFRVVHSGGKVYQDDATFLLVNSPMVPVAVP